MFFKTVSHLWTLLCVSSSLCKLFLWTSFTAFRTKNIASSEIKRVQLLVTKFKCWVWIGRLSRMIVFYSLYGDIYLHLWEVWYGLKLGSTSFELFFARVNLPLKQALIMQKEYRPWKGVCRLYQMRLSLHN